MIDYRKKLTTHRFINKITNIDGSIESDRGRLLSSPAFRRLQKRTRGKNMTSIARILDTKTFSQVDKEVKQKVRKFVERSIEFNLWDPIHLQIRFQVNRRVCNQIREHTDV